MRLQLQRPIAFIDLETTGIHISTDRIVEIAILKIAADGSSQEKRKLINPQMPIPAGSTQVHGITDDMVKNEPTFKQVSNELKQFLDNCDLGGYNSNRFDIPLLIEEFLRAGLNFSMEGRKLVDVQRIFHQMEQRTLTAAYKFYCNKDLEDAHSAAADVTATWEVLLAQVERYNELGDTVDSILKICGDNEMVDLAGRFIMKDGIETFNFGKHKGKPVEQVLKQEPQYYDWMMKGDFALNTKQKLTEILNRTLLKKA